jgi:hypothetical protein
MYDNKNLILHSCNMEHAQHENLEIFSCMHMNIIGILVSTKYYPTKEIPLTCI